VARQRRGHPGARPRPSRGSQRVPQAGGRGRADGPRACGGESAWSISAVLLLGDAPYYARFGFSAAKTGELALPGAFERDRLLAKELVDGALDGAWGMIMPTGATLPRRKAARVKKALRTAAAVA
jgi:hypothetical protein